MTDKLRAMVLAEQLKNANATCLQIGDRIGISAERVRELLPPSLAGAEAPRKRPKEAGASFLSVRLSAEEKRALEAIASSKKTTASALVRATLATAGLIGGQSVSNRSLTGHDSAGRLRHRPHTPSLQTPQGGDS